MLFPLASFGQKILTVEEAVKIAIENNYDIQLSVEDYAFAKAETSIYNSGYLPRITGRAGANYSEDTQNVQLADGEAVSIEGAVTESYNASITAEYTLFDGFERKWNNRRNELNLDAQELAKQNQIEQSITTLYEVFYSIAYQEQVVENLKFNIVNSENRLTRAQKRLKYGQGTKLDEFNAQVDLNTDSLSYRRAVTDLKNFKRDLNFVLGDTSDDISYKVDTTLVYLPFISKEEIDEFSSKNNKQLLLADQNVKLSEVDVKVNRSRYLPKINGSATYRWNESFNPPTSFAVTSEVYGVQLGMNLSWNIFDGGQNRTRVETAKITLDKRTLELQKIRHQVQVDINQAYQVYMDALAIVDSEKDNVLANERNWQRTQKQYALAQLNSIEVRQAQINYLNALNSLAQSRFDLKIAEVNLLRVAGILIDKV